MGSLTVTTGLTLPLFPSDPKTNLLPYDGIVNDFGLILSPLEADNFFEAILSETAWKSDEAVIFGKHIITKRKVAWYGDGEYIYHYSGTRKHSLPWTNSLLALKDLVEKKMDLTFNSCLLNLYHSGEEGMAWHADDEKSLGENTTIASLSLGAERKFSFRHRKTRETVSLVLAHGSLLVMKGDTQSNWQHCLPKSAKIKHPRINLTFRRFLEGT